MANFMGPMAPPQAAPQTPPQLDIRTNPGQRAQFKTFMQGMSRPAAPPTTAPIAPMLPAPTPMDQIDIFAPVPMASAAPAPMPMPMQSGLGAVRFEDGGPVRMRRGGSTFRTGSDGRTVISSDNIVRDDGMTDRERAAFSGVSSSVPSGVSGDDPYDEFSGGSDDNVFTGGIGTGDTGSVSLTVNQSSDSPTYFAAASGPDDVIQQQRAATDMDNLIARNQQTQQGFQDLLSSMGDIDESAGDFATVSPVAAAFTPFVDPQRDLLFGEPRFELPTGTDPIDDFDMLTLGVTPYTDSDRLLQGPPQFIEETRNAARTVSPLINKGLEAVSGYLDYPGTMFDRPTSGLVVQGTTMSPQQAADAQAFAAQRDALDNFLDRNPQPEPRDDARPDMVMRQNPVAFDPMTAPYMGMGADDFDFGPALPRDADIINNLLNRRVNYTTRSGNVIDRTVQDDLIERGKPSGLPGFIGKGLDILGANKAGKYLEQIAGGAPGVIDAKTGQLVGYVGEGFIKGTQTFSGRPGYNPFTGDAQNVKFDPSTNSYIVTPALPGSDSDERAPRALPQQVAPPVADSTPTDPPVVVDPVAPSPRPDPMNVVVPSTRVADPLGLTPPAFAPVQSVGLPQSFLDLLASFNRPAPVAMQEGGAVLDRAAGNFLEALKVA